MKRIAVLASGRGSNFQAVIDAMADNTLPARCCGLVTDNPSAYAIVRANEAGIPVFIVDFAAYPSKESYERALLEVLKDLSADLYILAGYMRIVGPLIIQELRGKMINIHPALLPSFPGLHAQRQAIEYGVKISGCTVHIVDEGMDTGPIILQAAVPVLEGDDEDRLAGRILQEEHRCLPLAARLFCEGKLEIRGRRVVIHPEQEKTPRNSGEIL
ncbi:MAG TPA: phosphoribosylglycinamide formyltransferase [Methanoregulaceae archaeon]|nr:MAG: phosphoribosylglycinamide formyltransferase [Methanolinea sp.]HON81913.1 phosphoribosylglycinamide formyltransferase [Methanoregulaceae archaeon]HPD10689.1 phosphoribosylglycinamide formyltransferase [Methanoregulaceae archaeon]HRT15818.1 phosphoribosylglycinamide formyltransferase [Methanoregulaceae archaeon]HRU31332.1 phosphoribosylglycinamide formyltransferase [Methanoregulaceae archaeon]